MADAPIIIPAPDNKSYLKLLYGGTNKDGKPDLNIGLFGEDNQALNRGNDQIQIQEPVTAADNGYDHLKDVLKNGHLPDEEKKVLFEEINSDNWKPTLTALATNGQLPLTAGEYLGKSAKMMGVTEDQVNTWFGLSKVGQERANYQAYHEELAIYADPATGKVPHPEPFYADANKAALKAAGEPGLIKERNEAIDKFTGLIAQATTIDPKNPVKIEPSPDAMKQLKIGPGNLSDLSGLENFNTALDKMTNGTGEDHTFYAKWLKGVETDAGYPAKEQKQAQYRMIEAHRIASAAIEAADGDQVKLANIEKGLGALEADAMAKGNKELGRVLATAIGDDLVEKGFPAGQKVPSLIGGMYNENKANKTDSPKEKFEGAAGIAIQNKAEADYDSKCGDHPGAAPESSDGERQPLASGEDAPAASAHKPSAAGSGRHRPPRAAAGDDPAGEYSHEDAWLRAHPEAYHPAGNATASPPWDGNASGSFTNQTGYHTLKSNVADGTFYDNHLREAGMVRAAHNGYAADGEAEVINQAELNSMNKPPAQGAPPAQTAPSAAIGKPQSLVEGLAPNPQTPQSARQPSMHTQTMAEYQQQLKQFNRDNGTNYYYDEKSGQLVNVALPGAQQPYTAYGQNYGALAGAGIGFHVGLGVSVGGENGGFSHAGHGDQHTHHAPTGRGPGFHR